MIEEKIFTTGEIIIKRGEYLNKLNCIYAIITGNADIHLKNNSILKRGIGNILLYICIIDNSPIFPNDVIAQNLVKANMINIDLIRKFSYSNETFKHKVYL